VDDYNGDGYQWTWSSASNTTGGSGGYIWINGDFYINFDDKALTKIYQSEGCSSVTLSFDHDYNYYDGDYGQVQIQVDGGTWQTISTYNSDTSGHVTLDVSSYVAGSSTFRVRFRFVAYYDFYWKVDNVSVQSGG
jgi:hypothetical protein